MTDNGTLADALSRVMSGIGHIEKSGKAPAAMGGFPFVPETAVMNALQPLLVAEGIMLSPRGKLVQMDDYDTSSGKQMHLATVELEMWARRGEEELLWFTMVGQGADTADKAVGKAMTSAKKQGLLIANSVPTGDDPDAAATEATTQRVQARQERAAEVRQRVSLDDLRDRVLLRADEHAILPAVLNKILETIAPGKRFEDLDAEELTALGKRIVNGDFDLPTEPAAGEQDDTEASALPATTPPAGPTLDDILAATGGELVDDTAAGAPAAGGGAVASPPGGRTANATEAAKKAQARADAARVGRGG